MRGWTAIGIVAFTVGLAFASQEALRVAPANWLPAVVFFWISVAGLTLASLLWLYLQITLGPRATVAQRQLVKLEQQLGAVRGRKGWFGKRRARRLSAQAQALADRIDPPREAHNVYRRRLRLTNAVLALSAVLSLSFWIFAVLAPRMWPEAHWFTTADQPDGYRAALFSFDQMTRGTMFDLFDVFDWNLSGLHNAPENPWFSAFIVVFRIFVGGALVAALAVRLGMREDWHEKAAHEAAAATKARLSKLAAGGQPQAQPE